MKNTGSRIAIVLALSASANSFAADMNSIVSSGVNSLFSSGGNYSLGLPPIFGDSSATVQCSARNIFSGNVSNFDLCKFTNSIDSFISKYGGNALDLGVCSLSLNKPLSCQSDSLKRMCQKRANSTVNEVVGGVRNTKDKINDVGRKNVVFTGGDQVAKNTLCDDMDKTIKKFPEEVKATATATALSGTGAYGNTINTRNYSNTEECHAAMYKAGKTSADATRHCSPYSIASVNNGETPKSVDDGSIKAATETLKSPLTKTASNASVDEAGMSKTLSDECGSLTSSDAISSCSENVLKNTYGINDKQAAAIAKIEEVEAGKAELFMQGAEHKKSITHPTEDYKNRLPIQERTIYAGTAKRSMAQRSLIASYYKRIAESKKELLYLINQKKEIMAKPFYPKAEEASIPKTSSSSSSGSGSGSSMPSTSASSSGGSK